MKKTYINPAIEVVTIKVQNLLTVSNVGFGSSVSNANVAEGRDDDGDWEDEDY